MGIHVGTLWLSLTLLSIKALPCQLETQNNTKTGFFSIHKKVYIIRIQLCQFPGVCSEILAPASPTVDEMGPGFLDSFSMRKNLGS